MVVHLRPHFDALVREGKEAALETTLVHAQIEPKDEELFLKLHEYLGRHRVIVVADPALHTTLNQIAAEMIEERQHTARLIKTTLAMHPEWFFVCLRVF